MTRPEQQIFDELAVLCVSPGYIHAIANICFRDNMVGFGDQLTPEDMARMFSDSRLIRTEISTLIGLMVRQPIDFSLQTPDAIQSYINRSEALLRELHDSMKSDWFKDFHPEKLKSKDFNPFSTANALREPIFYGGESAYSFQYRDLAEQKYSADASWLEQNKGLSISSTVAVAKTLAALLSEKLMATLEAMSDLHPDGWTMLPGFTFSADELANQAGMPLDAVTTILEAFCLPSTDRNATFTALNEFNVTNALPLLRNGKGEFVLLQYYPFVEAVYESPFYWMCADTSYTPTALRNRGEFTEAFCRERLVRVFGETSVHQGVRLFKNKGLELGEIDVLVVFGDRAIVLQAKSKRLTLEARKGNDLQLKSDFKKAVQDASDQANLCAAVLRDATDELRDASGKPLILPLPLKQIFLVCVVADHYPALAFQARQFLKYKTTDRICPPLVTDVFALDAMTEMLASPLRFLSYLSHRAQFNEKLMMSHELTLLSYHLKHNLWVDSNNDMMMLHDDFSADLDVAMAVRREDLPGADTPNGILTRYRDSHFGRLLANIESNPNPAAIALGLMLTELNEDTIRDINQGIDGAIKATEKDSRSHDFSAVIGSASTGLTIHCNSRSDFEAGHQLREHIEKRKYVHRANSWFGLAIRPDGSLRFALKIEDRWKANEQMDVLTAGMPYAPIGSRKPGRNDPCPCGSGKKYKKCHLNDNLA